MSSDELRGRLRGRDCGKRQEILCSVSAMPAKWERLMVALSASLVSSRTMLVLMLEPSLEGFSLAICSFRKRNRWPVGEVKVCVGIGMVVCAHVVEVGSTFL